MTTAMGATRVRLVVVGGVLQLQHCALYDDHLTAVLHSHHVVPESWWKAAGLPATSPLLELCPTCHYDVHAGIDSLIEGRDATALPKLCQAQAQAALDGAAAAGLVPALTL
jgi:hypothetical protein